MMNTHLVKAVFAVPDVSLKSVRLGQNQTILLDAVQHPLQGVVTSISPQADPQASLFGVVIWGIYGYFSMPQRKDPEIPVRVAVAACQWP